MHKVPTYYVHLLPCTMYVQRAQLPKKLSMHARPRYKPDTQYYYYIVSMLLDRQWQVPTYYSAPPRCSLLTPCTYYVVLTYYVEKMLVAIRFHPLHHATSPHLRSVRCHGDILEPTQYIVVFLSTTITMYVVYIPIVCSWSTWFGIKICNFSPLAISAIPIFGRVDSANRRSISYKLTTTNIIVHNTQQQYYPKHLLPPMYKLHSTRLSHQGEPCQFSLNSRLCNQAPKKET